MCIAARQEHGKSQLPIRCLKSALMVWVLVVMRALAWFRLSSQPMPRFPTVFLSQAAIRDKFPDVKEVTFVDA